MSENKDFIILSKDTFQFWDNRLKSMCIRGGIIGLLDLDPAVRANAIVTRPILEDYASLNEIDQSPEFTSFNIRRYDDNVDKYKRYKKAHDAVSNFIDQSVDNTNYQIFNGISPEDIFGRYSAARRAYRSTSSAGVRNHFKMLFDLQQTAPTRLGASIFIQKAEEYLNEIETACRTNNWNPMHVLLSEVLINGIFKGSESLRHLQSNLSMADDLDLANFKTQILNVSERAEFAKSTKQLISNPNNNGRVNAAATDISKVKSVEENSKPKSKIENNKKSKCSVCPNAKHDDENCFVQHPEKRQEYNNKRHGKATSALQINTLSSEKKAILSQFDDYLLFFPEDHQLGQVSSVCGEKLSTNTNTSHFKVFSQDADQIGSISMVCSGEPLPDSDVLVNGSIDLPSPFTLRILLVKICQILFFLRI